MRGGNESARPGGEADEDALIEAIRCDPPDAAALQTLVDRYWRTVFARCRLLTTSADDARDLAQETWCRVLRARRSLQPGGSLVGYLTTTATNLWRDRRRTARRAIELADHRLLSLDAPSDVASSESASLADAIPDPGSIDLASRSVLRMDLDRALDALAPRLRDVLLSRYIDGESAAEIGRRYQRSEQTITSWIRQASQEVRLALGEGVRAAPAADATRRFSARIAASGGDSAGGDEAAAG